MWWKILLVIVALPIVLAIVTAVIGLFLPRGHTAERTRPYARPAAEIWALVSDFARHPEWRSLESMERLPDRDGNPVWREIHAKGDRFDMAVVEFEPPRRMVTQIVDHRHFGGTWTWTVEPDADDAGACTLTIREDGAIYNPIFRTVARFVMGYHGTMDGVHAALAEYVARGP